MRNHDVSGNSRFALSLNAQRFLCALNRPIPLDERAATLPLGQIVELEPTAEITRGLGVVVTSLLDAALEEKGTIGIEVCERSGESFLVIRTTPGPEREKRLARLKAEADAAFDKLDAEFGGRAAERLAK
jgi:hypothetical protein